MMNKFHNQLEGYHFSLSFVYIAKPVISLTYRSGLMLHGNAISGFPRTLISRVRYVGELRSHLLILHNHNEKVQVIPGIPFIVQHKRNPVFSK